MNMQTLEKKRVNQQWEFAVDSLPQFICLLARNGQVIRANRAVERWNLGIDSTAAGGLYLHDVLHPGCDNSRCYLRSFWNRAGVALASDRRASCDVWDPVLKRHFLIRARRSIPAPQEHNSPNEVFAVVTIDDATEFKVIEKESDELTRVLNQRVGHEQGRRTRAEQVHGRIMDIINNTPSFFAMADAGGALYFLNPAGRALLGLNSQEEACGMSLLECHAPRVREHLTNSVMPEAARDGSWSGESVLLARDGRQIRTTLTIIAHHDDDGRLVGFSAQERDMTEWVKADEALLAPQIELRRLTAQYLTMQETERRRIAGDLHDGLGQTLSLLKLGIHAALNQMGAGVPPKAIQSVKQLLPQVAGALDEVRRVAMNLRPSSLDVLGILPTLSWFVREFKSTNMKARIETQISACEKDVPEPLKIVIFRILQEAVNNAVKHSDADCIRISLHNAGAGLAFTIADDGKGFDPRALPSRVDARRGHGMQSMRERAEVSGGIYTVTSAIGQGTTVCVVWPPEQVLTAQYPGCGASEVAHGVLAVRNDTKNAANVRKNVATTKAHRALRDIARIEVAEAA